jgi:hypothetical protein
MSRSPNHSPLAPPDERFWQRYSPHHEFSLSFVSSVFVHAIFFAFVGLIIAGVVTGLTRDNGRIPTDLLIVKDPGGTPSGTADRAPFPPGPETVDAVGRTPNPMQPDVEPGKIEKPVVTHAPPLSVAKNSGRLIDFEPFTNMRSADPARSKPPKGNGPGGDGPGKLHEKRVARLNRWVMVFNTRDGKDYASQLQGLGAILAIPQEAQQYLVARDLSKRPLDFKTEDVRKLDRIFWIDNKAASVESLSKALGIQPAPKYIVAFFPEKVETHLRAEEEKHFKGDEKKIAETYFDVVRRPSGEYEPMFRDIRLTE